VYGSGCAEDVEHQIRTDCPVPSRRRLATSPGSRRASEAVAAATQARPRRLSAVPASVISPGPRTAARSRARSPAHGLSGLWRTRARAALPRLDATISLWSAKRHGRGTFTRIPNRSPTARAGWPVFRCPSVAGLGVHRGCLFVGSDDAAEINATFVWLRGSCLMAARRPRVAPEPCSGARIRCR
jgi:hypothetical protein